MDSLTSKLTIASAFKGETRTQFGNIVKPNKRHLALLNKSLSTSPGCATIDVWSTWYKKTPWNSWRRDHPRAKPNLSATNLEGLALVPVDLSDAKFICSNLSHSSLSNLHKADLTECNLHRADLIDALLNESCFFCANLSNADLSDCSASLADFTGANLQGAIACECEIFGACFLSANLRGAKLAGGSFVNSDFEAANLEGADASYGNFQSCDFRGANLKGTNFTKSNLEGANFDAALIDDQTKVPKKWLSLVMAKARKGDGEHPADYHSDHFPS